MSRHGESGENFSHLRSKLASPLPSHELASDLVLRRVSEQEGDSERGSVLRRRVGRVVVPHCLSSEYESVPKEEDEGNVQVHGVEDASHL